MNNVKDINVRSSKSSRERSVGNAAGRVGATDVSDVTFRQDRGWRSFAASRSYRRQRSFDVSPLSTFQDRANCCHAVFIGELLHRDIAATIPKSDSHDVGVRQVRRVVVFASRWICFVSAFLHHVLSVVFQCSDKEVSRIDADRPIAAVEHVEPVRDRPNDQLPRDAVRPAPSITHSSSTDNSVAARRRTSCPIPAPSKRRIGQWYRSVLVDLCPETILYRDWLRSSFAHRLILPREAVRWRK